MMHPIVTADAGSAGFLFPYPRQLCECLEKGALSLEAERGLDLNLRIQNFVFLIPDRFRGAFPRQGCGEPRLKG